MPNSGRLRSFLMFWVVCLTSLSAKPGSEIPLSAEDCTDLPQQHANACIANYYRRVDKDLNLIYRELTAKLGPKEKDLLQKAQLSWIGFRDHSCDFEGLKFDGGTLQPFTVGLCRASLTEKRIKDLGEALKHYREFPTRAKPQ